MDALEKNSAHYPLEAIKALVLERGLNAFTKSASDNARLMGLDRIGTVSVVLSLQRGMLFKSMTTHADHRVWQDVYHAPCPNGKTAYIKVTVQVGDVAPEKRTP